MAVRELEKTQWQRYFDRMSKALPGESAEIEVASIELGDQVEAGWVPVLGITYDPKDDALDIELDGVAGHRISKPVQIYVDDGVDGLDNFEVIDHAGVHHIVQLREPLMLPAPSAAR
jgi:hypothetical protein